MRFRGQTRVGVPHQFHHFTLGSSGEMEVRAERVTQRMEIHHPTLGIGFSNPSRLQVFVEHFSTFYFLTAFDLVRLLRFDMIRALKMES